MSNSHNKKLQPFLQQIIKKRPKALSTVLINRYIKMVYKLPRTRFERVTYCLGGSCSILLSYRGMYRLCLFSRGEW